MYIADRWVVFCFHKHTWLAIGQDIKLKIFLKQNLICDKWLTNTTNTCYFYWVYHSEIISMFKHMPFIILYLNTSKITIRYFHDFKVLFFLYDTINIKKLFSYLLQLPDPSNTIDKEGRSESPNDELRQSELNRMASIRLHQKLVQSHDKQWPSGSEVNTQTDKQTK